mgnify:CR=1 FL=1
MIYIKYKDSDKIIYIPDVVENYDFSDPHLHKKKKAYSHLISRINVEWILDESEERCFVNNLENLKNDFFIITINICFFNNYIKKFLNMKLTILVTSH